MPVPIDLSRNERLILQKRSTLPFCPFPGKLTKVQFDFCVTSAKLRFFLLPCATKDLSIKGWELWTKKTTFISTSITTRWLPLTQFQAYSFIKLGDDTVPRIFRHPAPSSLALSAWRLIVNMRM